MENNIGEGSAVVGATGIPSHSTNFFVNGRQNLPVYSRLTPVSSAAILPLCAVYASIHINATKNDGLTGLFSVHLLVTRILEVLKAELQNEEKQSNSEALG